MSDDNAPRQLTKALEQYQFGNLGAALRLLDSHRATHGETDDVVYWRRLIADRLDPPPAAEVTLAYQSWTHGMWEHDWLNANLRGLAAHEVDDNAYAVTTPRMVVVDNRISADKVGYYRRAYAAGSRIVLVHLSDEVFQDDHGVYRWCHSVFRNYYSPILAGHPNVSFFALGCKRGFVTRQPPAPAEARPHEWSFAGDPNKTTRAAMLQAMRRIPGGVEHLTSGFNAPDSLPVDRYRALMDQSVFIPCPMGWVTLDSFRIYEALEAGCVPIVERRPGFDYFMEMYGDYPFPSVLNWNEAVTLIAHLQANGLVPGMQHACQRWWADYKRTLALRFRSAVAALLA